MDCGVYKGHAGSADARSMTLKQIAQYSVASCALNCRFYGSAGLSRPLPSVPDNLCQMPTSTPASWEAPETFYPLRPYLLRKLLPWYNSCVRRHPWNVHFRGTTHTSPRCLRRGSPIVSATLLRLKGFELGTA